MPEPIGTDPPAAPAAVPYEATLDAQWTDKAYDLIEAGTLTARMLVDDKRYTAVVAGQCPRCGHHLETVLPLTGYVRDYAVRGIGDDVPTQVNVDVLCGCGIPHAGAPPETPGCGVGFRVEFGS